MSWQHNALTAMLGLRFPIIQGPFGGGLSSVSLAATVANAGGLGSFGAHHLPPTDIVNLVSQLRQRTDRPFNINLWVSDHDADGLSMTSEAYQQHLRQLKPLYEHFDVEPPSAPESYTHRFEAQVQAVLDARPPVLSVVYGIPSPDIIEQCKRRNISLLGTATTVKEAVALQDAGVDAVIATGFEAGGHRVSFMEDAEDVLTGSISLIPQVVDALQIPVIAAGGIADARGVAAALMLGAQSVQIGTAFLACDESATIPAHKTLLRRGIHQQTVLSRRLTGRLARFIPNAVLRDLEALPLLPFPLQSWFFAPFKRAAAVRNDAELFSLYASQSTPLIRHQRAELLLRELVEGVDQLFSPRFTQSSKDN